MAMGKLSVGDVRRVAGLAKLGLSAGEVKKFQQQLVEVLDYMKELGEVEVGGVEPTAQTTGLTNVMRGDEVVNEGLSQEEALSGTERGENGYFVVEAVLDKER